MSIDSGADRPSRIFPQTLETVLQAWSVRAAGAALALCSLTISIAMLTWSANDPSISLDTSAPAQNLLGLPGAMIADFFFHTLGVSVVFFVVPPLVLGVQLALGDKIDDIKRRLALMALATIAIAVGCSALPLTQHWPFQLGYGGILGDFTLSLAVGLLDKVAAGSGGTIAGIIFFALGFWAFSRAICIDRYNIFAIDGSWRLPSRRSAASTARPKPEKRPRSPREDASRDHAQNTAEAPLDWPQPAEEPVRPWSLNARLRDYVEPQTEGGTQASPQPADAESQAPEDHARVIATRFAPKHAQNSPEPAVVMAGNADDDALMDLPKVLIKARAETAEIAARQQPPPAKSALWPVLPMPVQQRSPDNDAERAPEATPAPDQRTGQAPKVVANGYRRPSLNLLNAQKPSRPSADLTPTVLQGRARMLEDVLRDFRIKGEIKEVKPGPVITLFELEPARGTKSSRVIALADDVARSMSAVSTRIAVVPGRNVIGIELPNTRRETFGLRELIDSQEFQNFNAKLPLVLGKDIAGEPVFADLARMPHLLVAGTTGSGKSVGINSMILSLIYRLGPQDCKLLLIDPKMLELSAYNGIPHLLTPVITDPQKAVTALTWAVGEMEERYKRMAELGVRGIEAFNNRVKHANRTGEKLSRTVQTGFDPATGEAVYEEAIIEAEPIPHIVIVVDEFADLMAVAGKEIEGLVQRLAQMARASGIHMIMATQRPSVDVVTGTIKANFPTRISYRVASRIDSRTILGEQGGEQLLGHGDMLHLDGSGQVQRVHGPFVSDDEVAAVSSALRKTYPTAYNDDVLAISDEGPTAQTDEKTKDLFDTAVAIVQEEQKASTSYLQRRLGIGYNRAADLIDRMEEQGIIGPAGNAGRREILLAG